MSMVLNPARMVEALSRTMETRTISVALYSSMVFSSSSTRVRGLTETALLSTCVMVTLLLLPTAAAGDARPISRAATRSRDNNLVDRRFFIMYLLICLLKVQRGASETA